MTKKIIFFTFKNFKTRNRSKKGYGTGLKKMLFCCPFSIWRIFKSIPKYFGINNCTGLYGKIVGTMFVPPVGE